MNQQQETPPKMSKQDQWETLLLDDDDQDDSLSLSDLPLEALHDNHREEFKSFEAMEEFEFRTLDGGSLLPRAEMCAADEVFFKGQLLPLRLSSVGSQDNARYQCSSSSSGRSVSGSQSSSSHSSGCEVLPPRVSVSNVFYAYPSPRRHVSRRRTSIGSARKSPGPAPPGWNVFRLGITKTPEIKLNDLRHRPLRASTDKNKSSCAKKEKKYVSSSSIGLGFPCKCGRPDAVEPIPIPTQIKVANNNKMKEVKLGLKREENMCRSRMSEWLEELSIGKGLIG